MSRRCSIALLALCPQPAQPQEPPIARVAARFEPEVRRALPEVYLIGSTFKAQSR